MLAWDDFKLVKAVAEARSLAGASEKLHVNTSTVFRRLGTLEARLGARLFERKRGGYALTPAGEEMVELATRMSGEVDAFEIRIAGRDLKPSGELRVATNDAMIAYTLSPILARFRLAYPDIRLDIAIGNEAINLSRRDADIAIRATAQPPETLVGRRIATVIWGIYGLDDDRPVSSLAELADRKWVVPGDYLSSLKVMRHVREVIPRENMVYSLNSVMGLAEAVKAGIGLGVIPSYIGDKNGLKRLLLLPESSDTGFWILTHPDIRGSARVRAFLDFVGGELVKLRPAFEGTA
ncbi:LysR family transcriptional regulator [Flaviflagellibacter deserti]|uniref:LysR family transcriptional regulator n=1 Tax=Flaviflagellibacter deserti TaxID=2267266 RepID=A0ABV9Z0G7_9HYPH